MPLDSPAASEAEAADRVMQLVTCLSELGTYLLHKATWRSDDDHQSEALRLFEQAHMLCAESNLPSLGPHSSQARDALDNKAYLASQLMERREAICFPNARHTLHATNRTLDTLLGAGAADAAAMANVASNKRLQALQAKRCELNARYKQGPDALTMQREGEKYPPVAVPGQKKARLEAVARLTAPGGAAVGDIHQPGAAGRAARAVAAGAGGAPTALEWEEVTGLTVQVLANKEGHLGPDHPSLADVLERLARSLFLEAVAMRREHFEAKKRERGHGGVKAGAADKGGRVAAVKKKALSSSGPVSPIEKEKAKRARQRKAQKAKQDRILAPPPPTPWERRWEVAAIVLERALTLIQSSYSVKMNTRALVLQDLLAEVYYWLGRYEEADQLFFKSLQARSVLFDPEIGEASDPDNSDSDRSSDSDSDRGSGSGSDNGSERGCDDREASHGDDGGRGGEKLFGAMSMKSKKGSSRKQRGGRPGPGMTHPGRNGKPQGGRGGRSGGKSGGKGKSSGGSGGRSGRRGDVESGGGVQFGDTILEGDEDEYGGEDGFEEGDDDDTCSEYSLATTATNLDGGDGDGDGNMGLAKRPPHLRDAAAWLRSMRLGQYTAALAKRGIVQIEDLCHRVSEMDLDELGFKSLQKRRFLEGIKAAVASLIALRGSERRGRLEHVIGRGEGSVSVRSDERAKRRIPPKRLLGDLAPAEVLNTLNNISINAVAAAKQRRARQRAATQKRAIIKHRILQAREMDDKLYIDRRPLRESHVKGEVRIHSQVDVVVEVAVVSGAVSRAEAGAESVAATPSAPRPAKYKMEKRITYGHDPLGAADEMWTEPSLQL